MSFIQRLLEVMNIDETSQITSIPSEAKIVGTVLRTLLCVFT